MQSSQAAFWGGEAQLAGSWASEGESGMEAGASAPLSDNSLEAGEASPLPEKHSESGLVSQLARKAQVWIGQYVNTVTWWVVVPPPN